MSKLLEQQYEVTLRKNEQLHIENEKLKQFEICLGCGHKTETPSVRDDCPYCNAMAENEELKNDRKRLIENLEKEIDRLSEKANDAVEENVHLLAENKKLVDLLQEGCDVWYGDSGWDSFAKWVKKTEQALQGGKECIKNQDAIDCDDRLQLVDAYERLQAKNKRLSDEIKELKKELRDVYRLIASKTKGLNRLNKDNPGTLGKPLRRI